MVSTASYYNPQSGGTASFIGSTSNSWFNIVTTSVTTTGSTSVYPIGGGATGQVIGGAITSADNSWFDNALRLLAGHEYTLPDESILRIDDKGNFRVIDADQKVIYQANRIREFNPYINASDLLEDFIRDLGDLGVRQGEVLRVPVLAFVHWLIRKAAQKDGDPLEQLPPIQAALPAPMKKILHRCNSCGRFIKMSWAAHNIFFCSPQHMQALITKI